MVKTTQSSKAAYLTLKTLKEPLPAQTRPLTEKPPDEQRKDKYRYGNADDVCARPSVAVHWTRLEWIGNPLPGGHDGLPRSLPAVRSREAVLVGSARSKVDSKCETRVCLQ